MPILRCGDLEQERQCVCERERDRQRERERERESRERQRQRQRESETERDRERQRERWREGGREIERMTSAVNRAVVARQGHTQVLRHLKTSVLTRHNALLVGPCN